MPSVFEVRISCFLSIDQHRIPVAEKTVALLYCMPVSAADGLNSGKSRNKHQQGRLGKMKIGEQAVDDMEPVAGGDKNRSFPFELSLSCDGFQCPQCGRADRNHTPPIFFHPPDRIQSFHRHMKNLAVHLVIKDILHPYGLEGDHADVERHVGDRDAHFPDCFQQGLVEVQPGGWGGN